MPSRCACTFRSNVTYPSQLVWRLDNGYRHQDNDTLRWKWKCAGLVIMHIRFHLVFPGAPIIYGCSLSKQLTGCAGQRGKRKDKNRAKKQLWQGSVKNTWAKQKHNSSMGEKTVKESQRVWSIWKCCQMSGMEVFFRAPRLGLTSLPSKSVKPPSCERERAEQRFFLKGGNVDTLSHQKDWGLGSVRAAMERKWLHMTEKRNLRGHLLHQVLLHFVVIAKRQGTLFFLRTRLKTFVNGESAEAVTVKWKTKQKYGKAISIFNWVNIAVTHPSFSCKRSVATKIRARGCTFVHAIRYFPLLMCGLQTVNTDYILRLLLGLACIVH